MTDQIKPIDIHTHLFNVRYLPIEGILRGSFGMGKWKARALAKIAIGMTKKDRSLDETKDGPSAAYSLATKIGPPRNIEADIDDFDAFLRREANNLSVLDIMDPDILRALAEDPTFSDSQLSGVSFKEFKYKIVKHLIDPPPAPGKQYSLHSKAGDIIRKIKWFFAVATCTEREITRILKDTYPDVDIFVHHMMDMKSFYKTRKKQPRYEFDNRQIKRMERLVSAPENDGKFITFVAWDPFVENGLDIIKRGLQTKHCIGVKVYPPSGYRPAGNDGYHVNVKAPSAATLDARHEELFLYCAQNDIPVFTHCTPGAGGFEAYGETPAHETAGNNSDPAYWKTLLKKPGMANLRLCFGHAGGDFWFEDEAKFADIRISYPKKIIEICKDPTFPNVYFGFGILDEIHEESDFKLLQKRLGALFAYDPILADRIIYGSDWHMLFMHKHHKEFLNVYRRLFAGLPRQPGTGIDIYSDKFFRRNALNYLNISEPLLTS